MEIHENYFEDEADSVEDALQRLPAANEGMRKAVALLHDVLTAAHNIEDNERISLALGYGTPLWLHAKGVCDITPVNLAADGALWNVPSANVLARSVTDAFLSLWYFALEEANDEERDFRAHLARRHVVCKQQNMLREIGVYSAAARRLESEQALIETTSRTAVKDHPYLHKIEEKTANNIRSDDERFFVEPAHAIWARAGLPSELYWAMFKGLSQYVHTTPHSIATQVINRAGTEDGATAMMVPINLTTVCVVIALTRLVELDPRLRSVDLSLLNDL